jgi:hypothetical protein
MRSPLLGIARIKRVCANAGGASAATAAAPVARVNSRRVMRSSCPSSLHCGVVYHRGPICPLLLGAAQSR